MFINSLEVVFVYVEPLDLPGRLDEDSLELGVGRLLVNDDVEHIGLSLPDDLVQVRDVVSAKKNPERINAIFKMIIFFFLPKLIRPVIGTYQNGIMIFSMCSKPSSSNIRSNQ